MQSASQVSSVHRLGPEGGSPDGQQDVRARQEEGEGEKRKSSCPPNRGPRGRRMEGESGAAVKESLSSTSSPPPLLQRKKKEEGAPPAPEREGGKKEGPAEKMDYDWIPLGPELRPPKRTEVPPLWE